MPILLKRSLTTGSIPTTSSLQPGEIAVNVPDGKIYVRQSGSLGNTIRSIPVLDVSNSGSLILTGSLNVTGGITGSLSGSVQSATSASYALTASYALSGVSGSGGSASTNLITSSVIYMSGSSVTDTYLDFSGTSQFYANNATVDFLNFAGIIIVNDTAATGRVTMWLVGGSGVAKIGGTSTDVGAVTFVTTPSNRYRWTNNTGANMSGSISLIRTRNSA